ncbi:hypothetical protein DPMN_004523 [Dreissena polymorpha]|uniref:Uncharacterized protein n=1 Tax=Dreissena polymorpha TaxID=45954 RepID=A0A9D4RTM2_DREPO|nr:hypothetical protein DPMN_004523 [Dreissena polymorpha]
MNPRPHSVVETDFVVTVRDNLDPDSGALTDAVRRTIWLSSNLHIRSALFREGEVRQLYRASTHSLTSQTANQNHSDGLSWPTRYRQPLFQLTQTLLVRSLELMVAA